jgi:hypothetical protein
MMRCKSGCRDLRLMLDDGKATLHHLLPAHANNIAPALKAIEQKREGKALWSADRPMALERL